jgi:SAM-dependent methyltransferase
VLANATRFCGGAERYDRSRPSPPRILLKLLPRLAGVRRPALVVDLGSGTGLSTRPWAAVARRVVGIEPNDDMRARAIEATRSRNVSYRAGFSHATGLKAGSVDIVFVMQALHWMEPGPTWREILRLLRPGGVVASVHAEMPPMIDPRLDGAIRNVELTANRLKARRRLDPAERKWTREEHIHCLESGGGFGWRREVGLHDVDEGDAERAVGLAMSMGDTAKALKYGVAEGDLRLDVLRRVAREVMGRRRMPWLWSYNALIAVRR